MRVPADRSHNQQARPRKLQTYRVADDRRPPSVALATTGPRRHLTTARGHSSAPPDIPFTRLRIITTGSRLHRTGQSCRDMC